jgi:ABC-type transport system substrate-binding protein
MLEGSEALTPVAPAKDQKPAAGFPSRSKEVFTFVRNPSWVPATDGLRVAYADRIEIHLFPTIADIQKAIDDGSIDLMMVNAAPLRVSLTQFHRYQADPSLGRTFVFPRDALRYASMNLAAPPFDDVHVRRAANYIVNKAAYISAIGELSGEPATHMILDSLENDQLVNYDPYRTGSPEDALAKAEAEMRLSKYDRNHDGICDAPQCTDVNALAFSIQFPAAIKAARSVASDLARIGIKLKMKEVDAGTFFTEMTIPQKRIAIGIAPGWVHDFLNASNYVTPLFAGPGVSVAFTVPGGGPGQCCNFSLVGATPPALKGWGYPVTHVLSADDRINQCLYLAGQPQLQCWTTLDQYLTQTVVPWIPLSQENSVTVIPARVLNFTYDQFTTMPSLDQIVVRAVPSASRS